MYCPVLLLDMAYSVIQPVSPRRGHLPLRLPEVLLPEAHSSNRLSSLFQNRPMHGICERTVFSITARGYPDVWFATRYAGGRLRLTPGSTTRGRLDLYELDVLVARGRQGHLSEVAFSLPLPCLGYTLRVSDFIWNGIAAYDAQNTRPYIHPDIPI